MIILYDMDLYLKFYKAYNINVGSTSKTEWKKKWPIIK